jgi:hypothetical protein
LVEFSLGTNNSIKRLLLNNNNLTKFDLGNNSSIT